MRAPSKAQRDVIMLTAGRVGAAALSFVWLLVVARHLGPGTFGQLMTLLSLGALLSFVHDGGHVFALTETVARDHARLVPSIRFVIRRRLGLACGAALVVGGIYAATFKWDLAPPAVFTVSVLATAVYTTITAGLRGAEIIAPDATNEALSRLLIVMIGVPIVLAGGGLLGAVVAYSATDLISAVALGLFFRHLAMSRDRPFRSVERESFAWRRLIPLAAAVAVGTVSYRIDIWMVAVLRDSEGAGIYGAAYRLLEGVLIPAGALVTARAASVLGAADADLARRVRRLGSASLAVALAPAVLVAAVAPQVQQLAFGRDYDASAQVLRLLLISAPATAVVIVLMPAVASRSRSLALKVVVLSAVSNVVANLALIPRWGPSGAAVATVVTQVLTCAVAYLVLRRRVSTGTPA